MRTPSPKAIRFIATRQHHETELSEDYVEEIADLISSKGEARVCDLASHFAVSHVTVIRSLQRLHKKNLLIMDPQEPIRLTAEGEQLAATCKKRHQFLLDYLLALGVPLKIASIDVEGMEHHISQETLEAMRSHLTTLQRSSLKG